MLYRTLQKKSIYLESKLIKREVKDEDISFFIDLLIESIPKLYSTGNYSNALELLQKWQTIYFDFFKKVHSNINTYKYAYSELTNELITDQVLIHIKLNNFIVDSESVSCNTTLSTYDPIRIDLTNTTSYPSESYGDYFNLINDSYKRSKLIFAIDHIKKVITKKILNEDERPPNNIGEMHYLAWAIHMLGNIFSVAEYHYISNLYYKDSLTIKENILAENGRCRDTPIGFIYYSYFLTKLKYIASSISRSEHNQLPDSIDEILKVKERINRHKKDIININERYYYSLLNSFEYNLAKMNFYFGNDREAIKGLESNIVSTREIGDRPGVLRAELHKSIIESSCGFTNKINISNIEDCLTGLSSVDKLSPVAKALIGQKHLLEYKVLVEKESIVQNISSLFLKAGITPHEAIAY